jgi:hypothetical protein
MALIVGARLVAAGYRARIVTFGAPRVAFLANLALPRLARSAFELAEYRRAGDPVPAVPPRPWFKHVTRGVEIGVALADPIANHSIKRYAADLAAPGMKVSCKAKRPGSSGNYARELANGPCYRIGRQADTNRQRN